MPKFGANDMGGTTYHWGAMTYDPNSPDVIGEPQWL